MLDINAMNSRTNEAFKTQLKIGIDILCVQETTWNSTSILTIAGVKIVYIILCLQHKTVLQAFYREWERLMFDKMFCFLRLHWNFYEVFRESLCETQSFLILIHFWPRFPFYILLKSRKIIRFLVISGATEWKNHPETAWSRYLKWQWRGCISLGTFGCWLRVVLPYALLFHWKRRKYNQKTELK